MVRVVNNEEEDIGPWQPTTRLVEAVGKEEEYVKAEAAATRVVGVGNCNKEDGKLWHGRHVMRTCSQPGG